MRDLWLNYAVHLEPTEHAVCKIGTVCLGECQVGDVSKGAFPYLCLRLGKGGGVSDRGGEGTLGLCHRRFR